MVFDPHEAETADTLGGERITMKAHSHHDVLFPAAHLILVCVVTVAYVTIDALEMAHDLW